MVVMYCENSEFWEKNKLQTFESRPKNPVI